MIPVETRGPRVAFATLGCKVNQAESEAMMREFAAAGYGLTDFDDPAEVYVLNSCSVTHVADRKSRQLVRQVRRHNPDALVVVTGCYAEIDGKDVAASIGADVVIGNDLKSEMVALVDERLKALHSSSETTMIWPSAEGREINPTARTRAMVKVQDGCNNFCSYCIVPLARGRERSIPIEGVLTQVKTLVESGYKEIVLTGVHAGAYGKGLPGNPTLAGLIERILSETPVNRLRISSIEPWDLQLALLDYLSDPRFCRHFHLPLQSGSDSVLQRMRRRYTSSEYASLVERIRSVDPDVAITTDVIVGFPGETEEEFDESSRVCREMGFARMHVFRYSPRNGTGAAKMAGQVSEQAKKLRSEALMVVSEESAALFRQRFIGGRLAVLWEHPKQDTLWTGLTDNYLRVDTVSGHGLSNQLLSTHILRESSDGLWGEVAELPLPLEGAEA